MDIEHRIPGEGMCDTMLEGVQNMTSLIQNILIDFECVLALKLFTNFNEICDLHYRPSAHKKNKTYHDFFNFVQMVTLIIQNMRITRVYDNDGVVYYTFKRYFHIWDTPDKKYPHTEWSIAQLCIIELKRILVEHRGKFKCEIRKLCGDSFDIKMFRLAWKTIINNMEQLLWVEPCSLECRVDCSCFSPRNPDKVLRIPDSIYTGVHLPSLYAISVHAIRKNGVVCKLPLPAIIKEDIITYYPAKHIETIYVYGLDP